MALIKQGGCLKGYWPLLARKSFIFLLVVSLSSLALPAQAKNHFIVLFDGSGSMTRDYPGFWGGEDNVRDDKAMARVMSASIRKIVTSIERNETLRSRGFKDFNPEEDIFSFLIFVADWDNPNFAPEELFYTDTDLLARSGELPTSRDYRFFDIRPGRARDAASGRLRNVFGGHSTIIAATNLSMPFIADKINGIEQVFQRDRPRENEFALDTVVDNIFIIRISDGQYNSRSNGSEEHNVVQDHADKYAGGTKGITQAARRGFERYQDISGRVTRAFDIGAREAQCAFPIQENSGLSNCGDNAYDYVIKSPGRGLLINYLKVEPKAPGAGLLARTDASEVKLRMIYRYANSGQAASGVRWTGENAIRMDSRVNNEEPFNMLPKEGEALQYTIDEGEGNDWQTCELREELGFCGNEGGPGFDFSPAAWHGAVRYRASYVLQFNRQQGQQGSMLYPYRIALKPVEWQVNLARAEAAPNDVIYKLPRDPGDPHFWVCFDSRHFLRCLDPRRLFSDTASQFDESALPIDNPGILKKYAEKYRPDIKPLLEAEGQEDVAPWMLARISEEKKDELSSQEQRMDIAARIIYLLLICLWLFWPYKKPDAKLTLVPGRVALDFDHRYEQGELFLAAYLYIKNKKAKDWRQTGLKDIKARLQSLNEGGDKPKGLILKRSESSPFAVNMPGEPLYKEKKIPAQKRIPVYFHPDKIVDLERMVGANSVAELDLPMRITLNMGGVSKTLHAKLPLKILPECGKLRIESHALSTKAGDAQATEARPMETGEGQVIKAHYEDGQNLQLCHYRLSHGADHHFSHRVQGELKVELFHQDAPKESAVLLSSLSEGKTAVPAPLIKFDLSYGEAQEFIVLVNCEQLKNPISQDEYRIKASKKLLNSDSGIGVTPVWELYQEWTLRLLRSNQRTDVSMQVIYGQRDILLNGSLRNVDNAFEVGSTQNPLSNDSNNRRDLFKVRLANACLNGRGFAEWEFQYNASAEQSQVQIDEGAVLLTYKNDKPIKSKGVLRDNEDESEQEFFIALNFDKARIHKRDFQIKFNVKVHWKIYAEGRQQSSNNEELTTRIDVICHLRHEPPRNILAIDFGTSALAVAYANQIKDKDFGLLPLHEPLLKLHKQEARCFDNPKNEKSDYLASVVNVNIDNTKLKNLRPEDENFLDLPMKQNALYEHSHKCCSSIKALISAGFNTLPLNMEGSDSYLTQQGGQLTAEAPPLYHVLVGAYKGLLKRFIEPFLQKKNLGYSHVLVTHPNTYSQHHIETLRSILNKAFAEASHANSGNKLYKENIDCMSESDAVAYHYLINAAKWHKGTYPDRERILVYDIGAGTLDLTHLDIHWDTARKTPKDTSPGVLHRAGVTIAGDMLDECIARDLHSLLSKELSGKDLYLTPIVADVSSQTQAPIMDKKEMRLMDELRKRIQGLKRDLSNSNASNALRLKLTDWKTDDSNDESDPIKLLKTEVDNTSQLYEQCRQLKGNEASAVFWEPTRQDIEQGECVKGFLERVTSRELELFFNGKIPPIDTLIISGRTSLWPDFKDRVLSTLNTNNRNQNISIIDFENNPDTLKSAVVMGVLEKKFRWDFFRLETPEFIGTPGFRYDTGPNEKDKKFVPFAECKEEFKTYHVSYASIVEIGFKTSNTFVHYDTIDVAKEQELTIRLDSGEGGILIYIIRDENQHEKRYTLDKENFPTLPNPKRPWPLGRQGLVKKSVEQLFEENG